MPEQIMPDQIMIDRFNRHINYLRVSITDWCNLRCIYCSPLDKIPKLKHEDVLTYEEILRIIKIGVGLGITKVRITGGEPLVRKGVYDFLARVTQIEKLRDVCLTTNGILLADHLDEIKNAGIKRLNISLDTLNRKKFIQITGYDKFDKVWHSIQQAHLKGFGPIKINVVALKGINEDELIEFGKLSLVYPFHIRFIEYMPIGNSQVDSTRHLLTPEIKERLGQIGKLIPLNIKTSQDGPAERYKFLNAPGEIGFISALSHHFCSTCNRLRLTAAGRLRACLLSDHEEDIKIVLRGGGTDAQLASIFFKAVRHKGIQHTISPGQTSKIKQQMTGIGG